MGNSCHFPSQTTRSGARGTSPCTSSSGENEGLKPCVVARIRQGIGDASQSMSLLSGSQRQPCMCSIASMGMAYCSLAVYSHRFCWSSHGKDAARGI